MRLLQSSHEDGGLGLNAVDFHSYPGLVHTYFDGEFWDVTTWLESVLGKQGAGQVGG